MKVLETGGYKKVIAEKEIRQGDILFSLDGEPTSQASKYSIQIDIDTHLHPTLNSNWRFVNHSCDPNVYVDTENRKMKALKNISAGDELCFNYNSTEYKMAAPFKCNCGSDKCYGEVKGFIYLPDEEQKSLLSLAAPHIRILAKNNTVIQ